MENDTYSVKPHARTYAQDGDRWVSLRSLRSQPHVSLGLESKEKAAPEPAVRPAEPSTKGAARSTYLSVTQKHEQARRRSAAYLSRFGTAVQEKEAQPAPAETPEAEPETENA